MKKKIKYTKGEIGKVEKVNDFLPKPEHLVLKSDSIKITISLTQDSFDFFESQASKYHVPCQKMIEILLDKYVNHYK